jgi:hypothetical protein
MNIRQAYKKPMAACLCVLLASCASTTPYLTPLDANELESLVLIIRETAEGKVTHSWQSANDFELPSTQHQASSDSVAGHIVLASWTRDCDRELSDCHRNCMSRPVPPDFNQYEYNRKRGGRSDYCNKICMPPYLDCKELERLRGQEFTAVDTAVDWLKRNHKTILVGTVIVIAGVVFVTVSAGAGAVVLAPALLVTSSEAALAPQYAEVSP